MAEDDAVFAEMREIVSQARDARVVLNRDRIVTRMMGKCDYCGGDRTTSSPPNMCPKCALKAIDTLLAFADAAIPILAQQEGSKE